jgi:NDP-sugar pyrophosphorylase family protein
MIRGGIIAAGQGTRLRADGYRVSKPMVPVAGRPLIDLTLDRFRVAGIRRLTIIINDTSDDCRQWLHEHAGDLDLDLIVRTTTSSYASFQAVASRLAGAPAVITTVDSVMPAGDFCGFVETAADVAGSAVALGLTDHVDDENPLWASLDADGRIRQLGGRQGTHVTAGLYWLPVSPGCATISAGWLPSTSRFAASFCRACSTSTGHATLRRPRRRTTVAKLAKWAGHERG